MNLSVDTLTGDLAVENSQLVLIGEQFGTQTEEVRQHVEQRLRTLFQDWFLDRSLGVPYFEEFFIKNYDVNVMETLLINEILGTPGVLRILEFNMTIDKGNRTLAVDTLTIQTTDDVIEFNEIEVP